MFGKVGNSQIFLNLNVHCRFLVVSCTSQKSFAKELTVFACIYLSTMITFEKKSYNFSAYDSISKLYFISTLFYLLPISSKGPNSSSGFRSIQCNSILITNINDEKSIFMQSLLQIIYLSFLLKAACLRNVYQCS